MRVLVIQLRQLGDLLMLTPLLRQLQARLPGASVDLLCEPLGARVLGRHPGLRRMLHLERGSGPAALFALGRRLRREHYDMVVDCQGLPKTGLLALLSGAPLRLGYAGRAWRLLAYNRRYARFNADYSALDKLKLLAHGLDRAAAPDLADLGLDFPVDAAAVAQAERFCRERFGPGGDLPPARPGGPLRWPVAALFGVSRRDYKVWPPAKLAETARRLRERGLLPFLVYGPGEEAPVAELARAIGEPCVAGYPPPSFAALKEILARCALFVGNDGGPKHLAALGGVPSATVYGRVHPEAWTRPDDADQTWVATASKTRSVPTAGPCLEVERLDEIPVDALWERVEQLAARGRIVGWQGDVPPPAAGRGAGRGRR